MLCPKCGKELPENTKFCLECGYQFPDIPTTETGMNPQPVKKSHKKAVIITSVAVAGAVAVGVPTFFIVKNNLGQQELKNNPTRYLAASVQRYVGEKEKDNDMFHLFQKITKTGSIKVTVNNEYVDGSALVGYDADKKQLYADISGQAKGGMETQSGSLKAYTDSDSLNVNYEMGENKGSYFVDLSNIKNDFEGSIFGDKNSSLYNEQIEQMVDNLEKSSRLAKKNDQMQKDFQTTAENIMKSFEKNGHVEIKRQSVNIEQQDYSADLVTYNFNAADIGLFMDDCKNEILQYVHTYNEDFAELYDNFSIEDLEKSFTSSVDSAKQSMDASTQVKIEFYTDTATQSILKIQYTQTEGDNVGSLTAEFPTKSDTLFSVRANNSGSKYGSNSSGFSLTQAKNDNGTVYTFKHDSSTGNNGTLTFDYNKKDSKLKITNNTGKQPDYYTTGYSLDYDFDVELNFECANNKISFGQEGWNVELSANSNIAPFKAEKNFFQMTAEEFEKLTGQSSIMRNAEISAKQSNAATLDAACKKLYAGTAAGSINSGSPSLELGNLDPSKLPAPDATAAQRREAAKALTIQDAIDYDGLTSAFADESPFDYGYSDADGTIIYLDEDMDMDGYSLLIYFDYMTLGELYDR